MMDYSSLSKEKLFELIKSAPDIPTLNRIRQDLLKYGYSKDGVMLITIERRKLELQGKDPGPEPEWPGANLPPITGEMRG